MFSFPEILVVLIIAVIVLGPKRLPETARKLGHWIGVLKRASEEFKQQLMTMDRMVDNTVKQVVPDIDQMEPGAILTTYEEVEKELTGTMQQAFGPPPASPDDLLEQPPIPGGLPPEPSPATLPPESVTSTPVTTPATDVSAAPTTQPGTPSPATPAAASDTSATPTPEAAPTPSATPAAVTGDVAKGEPA